ncbi:MAG: hypothetical protein NTW14_13935 [bacterium]|nr:hypothetical protein [bacterium]
MKRNRFTSLLILSLIMCSLALAVKVEAGGSIFSGLGYGTLEKYNSSRSAALGNAGIPLPDSMALNFVNPALLAKIQSTRFSVAGYFLSQQLKDNNASDVDSWAQVEAFALALRLKQGLAVAFFLSPYSRVDYQYGWHGSIDGAEYYQSYIGKGGLSRVALDVAWEFSSWGSIGAGPSAYWGKVEELRGSYFVPTNYTDVEYLNKKRWLAFSWNLGLSLHPNESLYIGTTFNPEIPIRLNETFSYTEDDSTTTTKQDYRLAAEYGLGATYLLSPKWLSVGQLIYSPWGAVKELPPNSDGYQDAVDLSAGFEYRPGAWDADNFLARLQYRFGLHWQSDYTTAQSSSVNGYFGTIGLGIPMNQGRDRLDIAVEIGQHGDLATNGGQELLIKTRIGLNIGESWFVRAKPPWEK